MTPGDQYFPSIASQRVRLQRRFRKTLSCEDTAFNVHVDRIARAILQTRRRPGGRRVSRVTAACELAEVRIRAFQSIVTPNGES